jgi:hypothetical protein
MFHYVGFNPQRDAALIVKEEEGRKRLVEPPQFVWPTLPPGAVLIDSEVSK